MFRVGIACWYSAGLVNRRLRVRIPAGAAVQFSSPELTLCIDLLYGVRSTLVLSQWHVKDPGHFAGSAGGRLHLNTHVPLTQRSRSGLPVLLSRHMCRNRSGNKFICIWSGNTRVQSSQFAEPLWTDRGQESEISVREPISALKKKKAQAGNEWSNILPKSS